jgi:hypothetical protein
MTDAELFTVWLWGLGAAAAVILVAAGLLIAILLVARSILAHAREAEETVAAIADDTAVIWELDATNQTAGEILMTTDSIAAHGSAIVEALHQPADSASKAR